MEDDTIETVEIANGPFRAQFLTIGASLRKLVVPGREGPANVVLGYRDLDEYRAHPRYYGAVAGRYANRIGGARFSLDGTEHRVADNGGGNNLHSGPQGLDTAAWRLKAHDSHRAVFACTSPAGASGFPGSLEVEVDYSLERDGLVITFSAATDAPTVVNLTHHAYFNLGGEGSASPILDHLLQIPASRITPVDAGLIPTGVYEDVAGTPFDFRTPKPIGRDIGADHAQLRLGHGYDHNWVVDAPAGPVRRVATLFDPGSGRVLEVHSCQPGVQFYSGNHLANGAPGTSGVIYPHRGGLCLEPQKYPDTPNKPQFGSARLNPGERYTHKMAFRFRVAKDAGEAFPA